MMCDFGTGNNNKMNWVLEDKQELIDIVCFPLDHSQSRVVVKINSWANCVCL